MAGEKNIIHMAKLAVCSVCAYFAFSTPAYAIPFIDQILALLTIGLSPIEKVLCTVLLIIIGDVGRGIATLAVMSMGIGAMLGKVTWGQALTVAAGIAIMFGAPLLLPLLLFDPLAPAFAIPCVPIVR